MQKYVKCYTCGRYFPLITQNDPQYSVKVNGNIEALCVNCFKAMIETTHRAIKEDR